MKDYSSIVVSSNVKLMRNLVGFEFPSVLSGDEGVKCLNKLADTVLSLDSEFKLYKIKTLPELDVNIMHEKKLISNRLIDTVGFGAVVLSNDERVAIMLNESDHLSLNCRLPGLALLVAYDRINAVDNQLLSKLDVAYDDSIGFLTSNLADVGTGLKASVTLFLPALTLLGKINEISSSLVGHNVEFNLMTDDEVEQQAYTYTVSNSQSIGKRESDYIVKVTEVAIKISEMEIRARNELLSFKHIDDVKDKVCRAWGILTNCYKISVGEAQQLLGELKMGVALDLIRFKEVKFIDNLLVDILPYSLTKISDSSVADSELDKYRATFICSVLTKKRIK